MKIAMTHVDLPNESKGGVAFQAHYLANSLIKRGHEVTMFTFSPAYPDCHYRVHQYYLPSALKRLQSLCLAIYLAKTDFSKFDIIHSHGDIFLMWNCHPLIRTFHGSAQDEAKSSISLKRKFYQTIFAGLEQIDAQIADVNVGVSQATQKRIPAVSIIIPCGVDIRKFSPSQKSEQPSILFVGTIGGRKRGNFLIKIFSQEIKTHFPDTQLWLVAERSIEGKGIVNFGKISLDKLSSLYQQAWVFCLPSTYEGFGIPYVEALATGTPVVASPNPGAYEILGGGEYGVIAEDSELSRQLIDLLKDEKKRQIYAEKGLKRAQDFSWEKVVTAYEKLYKETAKHPQNKLFNL